MNMARRTICVFILVHMGMLSQPDRSAAQTCQGTAVLSTELNAGEMACFTVTARDANGGVVRNWNSTGVDVTLTLLNSTANTDSSTRSWSADTNAYSWARLSRDGNPLPRQGPHVWIIPSQQFDSSGSVRVCFTCSKAEDFLRFSVRPDSVVIDDLAQPLHIVPLTFDSYLLRITPQVPAATTVYVKRPYELLATPRDRYLNPITDTVNTRFRARFPNDVHTDTATGKDIFTRHVTIYGTYRALLVSRVSALAGRDPLQQIFASPSEDTLRISGSDAYEVLDHAPRPFALLEPKSGAKHLFLYPHSTNFLTLRWERPDTADTYFRIRPFEHDTTLVSDTIRYTVVFIDSVSLTRVERIAADSQGTAPRYTLSDSTAWWLVTKMRGSDRVRFFTLYWYVEATDGVYVTRSSPPQDNAELGNRLYLWTVSMGIHEPAAGRASIQFHPAPTSGTTTIEVSLPRIAHIRVTLHNILGARIATLSDEFLDEGTHTFRFDACALPPGIYLCRLETESETITKLLTVVR